MKRIILVLGFVALCTPAHALCRSEKIDGQWKVICDPVPPPQPIPIVPHQEFGRMPQLGLPSLDPPPKPCDPYGRC